MTFDPHEVIKLQLGVVNEFYKGKTVDIHFIEDTLPATTYGGRPKTRTIVEDLNAIINPAANPKVWGEMAVLGESTLEMILWEGFDTQMEDQFFKTGNISKILILIDEVYYRIKEIKSPESIRSSIPYWLVLLTKAQHQPNP